jgi:hypothetical protein
MVGPNKTLIVSREPDARFTAITDAIREAPDGARILVQPGVYRESLVLSRPVELSADEGGRVILESEGGSCVRSGAAGAAIRDLYLECRAGRSNIRCAGIEVSSGSLTLENCRISCDSESCVRVEGPSTSARLRECRAIGSGRAGVEVTRGGRAVLDGCDLSGHGLAGLLLSDGGQADVHGTRLRDCEGFGVCALDGCQASLRECRLYGNERAAVGVAPGARVSVDDSQMRREGLTRWLARVIAIRIGLTSLGLGKVATHNIVFKMMSSLGEPLRPLAPTARGRLWVTVTSSEV